MGGGDISSFLSFVAYILLFLVSAIGITIKSCVSSIFRKKKCFRNEVVLITGGGQGLGKALAKRFAGQGAKVVLWDKNEKVLEEATSEIHEGGHFVKGYYCDVSNEDEVSSTARRVVDDVGDVTVLVNNAGILNNYPFHLLTASEIRTTLDVNVMGYFLTLRAFLPKMLEKNKGHLVAIASIAGLIGQVNETDYCASKFAVIGLMESLSEEIRLMGKKIVTTVVCPLAINTGLIKNLSSRSSALAPILSIDEAADAIMDAIAKEKFIVSVPGSIYSLLALSRLFPREVIEFVLDVVDYCRIPNTKLKINDKT